MKEIIRQKLGAITATTAKFNMLRELLQALVLKVIEESGYSKHIAFVGGTALRMLYDLRRFSEDLDFSLVSKGTFDFNKLINSLEHSFKAWDIQVEFKPKERGNVVNTFLKFPYLMNEYGLSHRPDQKIFIKLEIDRNPPEGFSTELSFNQKYLPMNILHYDLPSLYAGKLHAVLLRQYTKGRDFYDLMWFLGLGKDVKPNLTQLNNAIYQTTGKKTDLTLGILKEKLIERITKLDFEKVHTELEPFMENPDELIYLTLETLQQLIKKN